MLNQIRQGDVLLRRISKLPNDLKEKNKILAYGEVTGHKHQFNSEQVLVFEDEQRNQFIDVKEKAELLHEEHKNVLVPKGKYEVFLQREYDLVVGIRSVTD